MNIVKKAVCAALCLWLSTSTLVMAKDVLAVNEELAMLRAWQKERLQQTNRLVKTLTPDQLALRLAESEQLSIKEQQLFNELVTLINKSKRMGMTYSNILKGLYARGYLPSNNSTALRHYIAALREIITRHALEIGNAAQELGKKPGLSPLSKDLTVVTHSVANEQVIGLAKTPVKEPNESASTKDELQKATEQIDDADTQLINNKAKKPGTSASLKDEARQRQQSNGAARPASHVTGKTIAQTIINPSAQQLPPPPPPLQPSPAGSNATTPSTTILPPPPPPLQPSPAGSSATTPSTTILPPPPPLDIEKEVEEAKKENAKLKPAVEEIAAKLPPPPPPLPSSAPKPPAPPAQPQAADTTKRPSFLDDIAKQGGAGLKPIAQEQITVTAISDLSGKIKALRKESSDAAKKELAGLIDERQEKREAKYEQDIKDLTARKEFIQAGIMKKNKTRYVLDENDDSDYVEPQKPQAPASGSASQAAASSAPKPPAPPASSTPRPPAPPAQPVAQPGASAAPATGQPATLLDAIRKGKELKTVTDKKPAVGIAIAAEDPTTTTSGIVFDSVMLNKFKASQKPKDDEDDEEWK